MPASLASNCAICFALDHGVCGKQLESAPPLKPLCDTPLTTEDRDKVTSRRLNEDAIFQDLNRCYRNERKPDQALLDKQNAIENEIASLEQHLDEL